MQKSACPSCGAAVQFSSKAIVHVVCPYCHSLLVRHDLSLATLGKVAELQDELTPLQIGTEGQLGRRGFVLTGRLQRQWEGGYWSEWHALFSDLSSGWLAQAQGAYTMLLPSVQPSELPKAEALKQLQAETILRLDGQGYTVSDIKTSKIASYEGQLPDGAVPKDYLATSCITIDLNSDSDECASIEVNNDDEVRVFRGKHLNFDDLALKNLRDLDGW